MVATVASSVAEHRFGSSEPYTLGMEEEYMLLDPATLELVQRADTVLEAESGGEFAARTSCELFQSVIEGQTPVCPSADHAGRELWRLRRHLEQVTARNGLVLASSGTHPFAHYEDQLVTERERYRSVIEQIQYPARRELIFGLHVHVGVPDPDTAIQVVRLLGPHIPELIALSASSPFWRGFPTGLYSTRHSIFATFPRSRTPPPFSDYREFSAYVGALERAGAVDDYTKIWWDVRPHPRLGTVEVRAMDAVARVEDAIALAAYVQALVRHAVEAAPLPLPTALDSALARENKWQAIRYGLEAVTITANEGPLPIRGVIHRTLEELAVDAAALGSEAAIAGIEQISRRGTGAERQLATFAATGDIRAVARQVVAETARS